MLEILDVMHRSRRESSLGSSALVGRRGRGGVLDSDIATHPLPFDSGRLVAVMKLSEEPIIALTRRVTPSLRGAAAKVGNRDVGGHQDGTGDTGD